MIYVGFRYDDYGSLNTPFSVEEQIAKLLSRFEVYQNYAVVPSWLHNNNNFNNLISLLKSGHPYIDLSIHGCFHTKATNAAFLSEFAGLREEYRLELINSSKSYFEKFGLKVDSFVPPWNLFDDLDVRMLEKAKFKLLLAGPIHQMIKCYLSKAKQLKYLPFTTGLDTLEDIARLSTELKIDAVVVILYHSHNLIIKNQYDISILKRLFELCNCHPCITPMPLSKLVDYIDENLMLEFGKRQLCRYEIYNGMRERDCCLVQHALWLDSLPSDLLNDLYKLQMKCMPQYIMRQSRRKSAAWIRRLTNKKRMK